MSSFDRMLGWFPHTRGGCDMLKSVRIAALIAVLTPGAAVAEPIIIIISSQHNLEYARRACSSPLLNAEGIAECKFVGDGRHLGRKLENEVRSRMATNPRCQGADVFRQNHPDYDGKINFNELANQMKQVHWTLFLEYNPGKTTHNWTLFSWTGGDVSGGELVPGGMVEGEGTVSQIGDQICIVVTKRGANIRRHSNLAATQIPVVMVRTIAIWIFGLLASAIIGSLQA